MSLSAKISALAQRVATEFNTLRSQKQDKLVEQVNIKTINGMSILGSGDMEIQGGGGGGLGAPITVTPTNGIHVIDASLGKYFKLNIAEYTPAIQQLADISLVDSKMFNMGNTNTNWLNLASTSAENGDVVLLFIGSDGGMTNLPTGFTSIGSITVGSEYALACYAVYGDFNTTVATSGHSISTVAIAMYFRGVDTTIVLDAAMTNASGISGMPDSPAITTVTEKAMVVSVGFLDDDNIASSVSAPTGYSNLKTQQSSTIGQTVMAATKVVSAAGSEDPGAFTGTGSDDWVGMTIALRPKWLTIINELDTYVLITNTPTNEVYEAILEIECTSNKVIFPYEWSWNYLPNFKLNSGMQIRIISADAGTSFKAIAPIILSEYTKDLTLSATDIDWKAGAIFYKTLSANTTLTFSNLEQGKVITAIIDGNYTLALPGICKILSGEYNGGVTNYIQFMCVSQSLVLAVLSQEVL